MRADHAPVPDPADPAPGAGRTFIVAGHVVTAPKPPPALYLVATPIGNLGDITLRALETLAGVDAIACEDTRITRRLTERYGISTQLHQYHEHNAEQARPKILQRLSEGASIALVSDAGTPLISDPGFKLVREVCAAGHQVIALPGPSSVLAALAVAALPTDRFYFEGFLPSKQGARRTRLTDLSRIDATLVMFESGNRIADTLRDLAAIMGTRDASICRELTKLHEDISRGRIADLARDADEFETRGEFVVVIAPPAADAQVMAADDLDSVLRSAMKEASVKDAVAQAVELSGRPRREVYARALELAKEGGMTERKTAKAKAPAAPARVAAFNAGVTAETVAADYLKARGYVILATRFKTPYGEIDLVSQQQNLLAFIEVKARARLDDAAYAVTQRQQRRIIDAAQAWLAAHPEHADFDMRFDAMLIAPKHPPRHLMAAFDASS